MKYEDLFMSGPSPRVAVARAFLCAAFAYLNKVRIVPFLNRKCGYALCVGAGTFKLLYNGYNFLVSVNQDCQHMG